MIHLLTPEDELRFWSLVGEETDTGCWPWEGTRSTGGYGKFGFDGVRWYAHRVTFYLEHGYLPETGMDLDHAVCQFPPCVRPSHLEAVTHAENIRRHFRRQTHCKHGHEFTEANTYYGTSRRSCLTCRKNRVRAC